MKPLESAMISAGILMPLRLGLHADREHHQIVRRRVAVIALGVHAVQDQVADPSSSAMLRDLGLDEAAPSGPAAPSGRNPRSGRWRGCRCNRSSTSPSSPYASRTYCVCFSEAMQQMREQWRRWFSSREPAHWMKAMFFASLPSDGRRILPPVGSVRIGEALELDAGDHVGETVVAVGLDLRRVVGLPAGGPDDRADLDLDRSLPACRGRSRRTCTPPWPCRHPACR